MNSLLLSVLGNCTLPAQLHFLLHYRSITQRDFSTKLEISPMTLYNWLSGRISPSKAKYFRRISALLQCLPELLLQGSENCNPAVPDFPVLLRRRLSLHLSIRETASFLHLSESTLRKWEETAKAPAPYREILNALYSETAKAGHCRKESLSNLRILSSLSVQQVSELLQVRESDYWKWEWENAVPLDYLVPVSRLWNTGIREIPAGSCRPHMDRALALKCVRTACGISVRVLTRDYRITAYQSYERGSSVPSFSTLSRILSVFGTSTDEFLSACFRPACCERLEYLRKTQTPLSVHALHCCLRIQPNQYMQGLISGKSFRRFCLITDSLPYQLFLPLQPEEKDFSEDRLPPHALKRLRLRYNLSVEEAAEWLSLAPGTIRAFESGSRKISLYQIRALSSRFTSGIRALFEL